MLVLRESLIRGFKTRFFVEGAEGTLVHVSKFHGTVVRSVVFGRGFVEYLLEDPRSTSAFYEVTFTNTSLRTAVYSPLNFELVREFDNAPPGLSSGFPFIDRIVSELAMYRHFWARTLCCTRDHGLRFYTVDVLARGAIGQAIYGRVKELFQESSREYTGFVLGAIVSGLVRKGFKVSHTGNHCSSAEHAEPVSWTGTKIILSNDKSSVIIDVERRLGLANPDILIEHDGRRVLLECKTGPPKTWLSKAIKQGRIYGELGSAILVTSKHLGETELKMLGELYSAVIECSPINADKCIIQLVNFLAEELKQ